MQGMYEIILGDLRLMASAVPMTVAAPAALASMAYLNARWQISHDIGLIFGLIKTGVKASLMERRDQVNLFYRLEENAQNKRLADHALLIYEGRKWTFKETYELALRYGSWLKSTHGVQPKEIVAMDYMNSPKMIFVLFGIWSLGATPALINYNLTSKPLVHCVKAATARILLVDDEVQSHFTREVIDEIKAPGFLGEGKGGSTIVFHGAALEDKVAQITNPIRQPDGDRAGAGIKTGSRMASLIFTSGTTGLPKPAIGHRFSNQTFWRDVRESKATMIQYVGETCRYLIAAPPQTDPKTGEDIDKNHNVRLAFGNGMRPDVWQRFKDRFGIQTIAEFYGATEAPGATFNVSSNDYSRGAIGRAGSLLKLFASTNMAIVEIDWESEEPKRDPNNNNYCVPVQKGETGEWLFAIDPNDVETKYQGYFGNKKATSSKLLRDVFAPGDAWFRSGDAVRQDTEGMVWFQDRIGDTFRWRSENVSTNEVSEVLGGHPNVIEANVYGVEVPKHDGRCGCAAITFNKEVDSELMQSLANAARKNLPKYAVPLFLRVTKENHATGNNKQQKHGLRLQGVDPKKVSSKDILYWLKDGTYQKFNQNDYNSIQAGRVKL